MSRAISVAWLGAFVCSIGLCQDTETVGQQTVTVEQIAAGAQESVVVITTEGREAEETSLGSGFIISPDGLIATNLHVIGEARPVWVQRAGGEKRPVVEIHASDRSLDLAVVRIHAQNLPSLLLAEDDSLKVGQAVVAVGHPLGLTHSVVSGVVSGRREIDGVPVLQVAIPIESGNSGGPLLDMRGRVQGVLAMKSAQTDNLGFAVEVSQLLRLLEHPNPVPMDRWRTIGALDARDWTPHFGARWQQRAGRILVAGTGQGFGGRSLLLSTAQPPDGPLELAVSVSLDDESGAAGLIFNAHGTDRHCGFYPSNGRLRLTRFDGPTVFSWHVLQDVASPHYRPGCWNDLKVRLEEGKVSCFVNEHLVIESDRMGLPAGSVGLAKFRQTEAQFKHFRVGPQVAAVVPTVEMTQRVERQLQVLPQWSDMTDNDLSPLAELSDATLATLQVSAEQLRKRAEELERLADGVHVAAVCQHLVELTGDSEQKIDMLRAALWIARLDNRDLDVEAYVQQVDRMGQTIIASLPEGAGESEKLAALNAYLFRENGFHGSRTDYYHRANSYLDRVIDDREGLPITLSILYIELGRRLGLNIVGVGLPGHFVVRHEPKDGDQTLIDTFAGAVPLSRRDAELKVLAASGVTLTDDHLATTGKRAILLRVLTNLLGLAERKTDRQGMLRYLEAMVAVDPRTASTRGMRAVMRRENQRYRAALQDLDWFLEHQPPGIDLDQIRRMRAAFEEKE